MNFLTSAAVVIALYAMMIGLIRRNLRQRAESRRLREVFIGLADDLVGKPEFPEAHAHQLARLSAIPGGWATRYMIVALVQEILTGRSSIRLQPALTLEQIPPALRGHYALAILALALSDSYRCAILGRVWRGANSWVFAAVREIKPDVNAHATRTVVDQMNHAPEKRWAYKSKLAMA